MQTVIKTVSKTASFLEYDVITDFFGDGGAVTSKDTPDFLKGCRVIQHFHNGETFVRRQMFVFMHSGILLDLPASLDKNTKRFVRLTSTVYFVKVNSTGKCSEGGI